MALSPLIDSCKNQFAILVFFENGFLLVAPRHSVGYALTGGIVLDFFVINFVTRFTVLADLGDARPFFGFIRSQ
jgi:hypothetical protein